MSLCCKPTALEGFIVGEEDSLEDDDETGAACFDKEAVVLPVPVEVAVTDLLVLVVVLVALALALPLTAVGLYLVDTDDDVGTFDFVTALPLLLTVCRLELVALFKPKAAVLVAEAGRADGLVLVREVMRAEEEEDEAAPVLVVLVQETTTAPPPPVLPP